MGTLITIDNMSQYTSLMKDWVNNSSNNIHKPTTEGTQDQILRANGDGTARWDNAATQEEIGTAVTSWLDDNVSGGQGVVVDSTLTIEGAAADAKVTGNELSSVKSAINNISYIKMTITDNYYIDSTNGNAVATAAWAYATFNVEGLDGETASIATKLYSGSVAGWVVLLKDGTINASGTTENAAITLPENVDVVKISCFKNALSPENIKLNCDYSKQLAYKSAIGELPSGKTVVDLIGEEATARTQLSETGSVKTFHDITWQNGYVGATGVINSSSLSGFAIVPLEAGETVTIGTKNTNIAIISTTTETSLSVGDTVTPVKITTSVDTFQTYEYTAESSVNVVLCVRLSNYEVSFSKKSNLVTESEISNIIGLEKNIIYDGPLFSGTVDAITGEFTTTGAWRCTDYFQIPFVSGSKMTFTCTIYPGSDYGVAFYDYNKKYLAGIGASNASEWGITPSTTPIQTHTIVIPQNAAYIRTSVLSSSVSPSVFVFAGVTLGDIVNRVINLEYATQFSHIKPLKLLVLGDSYSAQRRWINALMGYFGNGSNYITLAVTGATVKDQSNDRTTYPYTSRPTSSGGTNQNTISCQIAKLERLMAGVDLDEGETQIYASEDDYPNVIIIEGGQNDFSDNDSTEETYFDQFEVAVDNVYIKQTASGEASVGVASVRPNIETINRTCFAGAYRYAIEKLMGIFPNAQIYITTASDISYRKNYAVTKVRYKIAEQQIKCARMASVTVIDWYSNGQMSVLNNTLTGGGTQADPYIVGGPTEDTLDSLHPNDRGAAKLGQVAARAIYSNWMDIE